MADNTMGWNGPITFNLTTGQSSTEVSRFSLDTFKPDGFFSLQGTVGTSGAATIAYELTNAPDGTAEADIQWDAGETAIVTSKTGVFFEQYPPVGDISFAKQIRLMASETTTSGSVTTEVTIWPNVQ